MIDETVSYDIQPPLRVVYVGDYKYMAVDAGFNEIVAAFDSHSDLSKWLLSHQDRHGGAPRALFVCRILVRHYDLILQQMQTFQVPLRKLLAVRSTLRKNY